MKKIVHPLFRLYLRIISSFFFDKIEIQGKENLPYGCPVVFACNHPNAFLDSIVMTTCVKRSLHYTARGDFFKSKIASSLLHFINILPVYRKEEGKYLLSKNTETFADCIEIFKENGAIIIFAEGLSENKWELRPTRKGTARLAFEAWDNPEIGDKLKIVPVAIHYSSWLKMFPVFSIEFLENIERHSFADITESGLFNRKFNERLTTILSNKCIIVDKTGDAVSQNKIIGFILKNIPNGASFAKKLQDNHLTLSGKAYESNYKALADFLNKENINYDSLSSFQLFLLLPSLLIVLIAYIYNLVPLYLCKFIAWKATKGNDFYDSLLYCILMVIYPLFGITMFCVIINHSGLWVGIANVFLATLGAYFYEDSKRVLLSFLKRKKLKEVHQMLSQLSETSNG